MTQRDAELLLELCTCVQSRVAARDSDKLVVKRKRGGANRGIRKSRKTQIDSSFNYSCVRARRRCRSFLLRRGAATGSDYLVVKAREESASQCAVSCVNPSYQRKHARFPTCDLLGGWVNPHREQQTIPQGQTSIPPKSFSTPTANGQIAP